jgi:hypothetical protein
VLLIPRRWFLFESFCYLAVGCVLQLVLLRRGSANVKELEIVVLRDELSVLRRLSIDDRRRYLGETQDATGVRARRLSRIELVPLVQYRPSDYS